MLRAQIKAYEEKHIQELKKYPEELVKLKDYYGTAKKEKMEKADKLLKDMENTAARFRNCENIYNKDMNHAVNKANTELNVKQREAETQKKEIADNLTRMEGIKADLDKMVQDKMKEAQAIFPMSQGGDPMNLGCRACDEGS